MTTTQDIAQDEARPISVVLTTLSVDAAEAKRLLDAALALISRLQQSLELSLKATVEHGINFQPGPSVPSSQHRREHRSGIPAKIDNDPEVRAFIQARIDRMTFAEIATEVAAYFPPERHVQKSAIHRWWQHNRPKN